MAQQVGGPALRLTAFVVVLLLGAALTLGVVGGLQVLPR